MHVANGLASLAPELTDVEMVYHGVRSTERSHVLPMLISIGLADDQAFHFDAQRCYSCTF